MYTNIIHRLDHGDDRFEAIKFQQDSAHEHGMRTTIFMTHGSLLKDKLVEYAKEQQKVFGDEIGLNFNEMMCGELEKIAESRENFIYLHTYSSKEKIVKYLFEMFNSKFGFIPKVVAGYILDAPILKIIKENYPEVKVAITNCFEEGVKMYHGNNYSWTLFCDGGPWGPYYPSKVNTLCPAENEEDAVGIVGLPHLNRDMILALTSRDDYFASHPVNVIRAKANIGGDSPYIRRFIDKWIEQAQLNGYSYYNMFVSSPWVVEGFPYVEHVEEARSLYVDSLRYLKTKADEGLVEVVTMEEFGDWYKANVKIGEPFVNLWDDLLNGTKRQMFWYIDPYMRAAFDLNSGGELRDLRPYTGKLNRDLGPDTEAIWNGNYPYLLSYEHRTWTYYSCMVHYNGKRVSVSDRRTKCSVSKNAEGNFVMTVNPVKLAIDDLKFTIQSKFTFVGQGEVEVERKLLEISDPEAVLTLEEQVRGCWGTTEYQENMKEIILSISNSITGEEKTIQYNYGTRKNEIEKGDWVKAMVPPVKASIEIKAIEGTDIGGYEEGSVFNPYYTLYLKKNVTKGGSMKSCLRIKRL